MKPMHLQPAVGEQPEGAAPWEHAEQVGLCDQQLTQQNACYRDTGGVSMNNRRQGFVPGYFDPHSGLMVRSCFADGRPAPVHLLEGLPDAWVAERDECGQVVRACSGIVAGFIRDGHFYTREQAARAVSAAA